MTPGRRNAVLGCAIGSLVAFFLPVIDLKVLSLTGFDMVRGFLTGGYELLDKTPFNALILVLPLAMPASAALKFAAWQRESDYSHVATGLLSVVLLGYFGISYGFGFLGGGVWIWTFVSVIAPIVVLAPGASGPMCPECGGSVGEDYDYCPNCTAKLD